MILGLILLEQNQQFFLKILPELSAIHGEKQRLALQTSFEKLLPNIPNSFNSEAQKNFLKALKEFASEIHGVDQTLLS